MEPRDWRNRLDAEDKLQKQLLQQMSQSAQRRGEALRDGVAELGSAAAVGRDRGISEKAVRNGLKNTAAAATAATSAQPTE